MSATAGYAPDDVMVQPYPLWIMWVEPEPDKVFSGPVVAWFVKDGLYRMPLAAIGPALSSPSVSAQVTYADRMPGPGKIAEFRRLTILNAKGVQ